MALDSALTPYGLEPKYFFLLVTLQCLLQGCLLSTLVSFFGSRSINKRPLWFRVYVLVVNVLSMTQTVLVILQGFELFNSMPPTQALGSAFMLLATIIGVLVQIFFIHRCWRIFNKRVWSLVPLVLLVLTTLISGILAESFGNQGRRVGPGPMTNTRIALVICLSCAFVVYVFVTTSTTVFICRTRTGLREHDGIFRMIWRVIWVSAAPPLITLTISIVNGYIVKSGSQNLTVVAGGLTAKFCNLSLMINLIGQVWIRRKFEVSRAPELPTISTSQTPGVISDPVFAISMTSLGAEGGQVTVPVETPITNPSDTFVSGHGDNGLDGSDTSSVKPAYDEARRSVHQVRFSMGP